MKSKCLKGTPKKFIGHFAGMAATCEPITLAKTMSRKDGERWKEAIDEKINSLKNNNIWQLVPFPKGRKHVNSKWVFLDTVKGKWGNKQVQSQISG